MVVRRIITGDRDGFMHGIELLRLHVLQLRGRGVADVHRVVGRARLCQHSAPGPDPEFGWMYV